MLNSVYFSTYSVVVVIFSSDSRCSRQNRVKTSRGPHSLKFTASASPAQWLLRPGIASRGEATSLAYSLAVSSGFVVGVAAQQSQPELDQVQKAGRFAYALLKGHSQECSDPRRSDVVCASLRFVSPVKD